MAPNSPISALSISVVGAISGQHMTFPSVRLAVVWCGVIGVVWFPLCGVVSLMWSPLCGVESLVWCGVPGMGSLVWCPWCGVDI